MFNKSKPDQDAGAGLGIPSPPQPEARPTPDAARPEPSRPMARSTNLSTLSAGVKYEGNISGGGDIQIDGALKGDVRVARVLIGESGVVEGSITADMIEVRGRIAGTVTAKTIKLLATSRVEGDLTHEQLSIDQGAWFQGRSTQAKPNAAPAALEAPAIDRYQPEKPAPQISAAAKADLKPA